MPEYIERKAAKYAIRDLPVELDALAVQRAIEAVSRVPAADVVPVVHARWIIPTIIDGRPFHICHCSFCKGVPCGVDENTKYCPNCGAKMDSEVCENENT